MLNAIYLILVTSILCLKLDEHMDRAREKFGHRTTIPSKSKNIIERNTFTNTFK